MGNGDFSNPVVRAYASGGLPEANRAERRLRKGLGIYVNLVRERVVLNRKPQLLLYIFPLFINNFPVMFQLIGPILFQ